MACGGTKCLGLPYDCRTVILQIMSDTLAMYDVICMRSLMFIKRCITGESDVVRFVAEYGVLYGGMFFVSGGMFLLIADIINYQLAIY